MIFKRKKVLRAQQRKYLSSHTPLPSCAALRDYSQAMGETDF